VYQSPSADASTVNLHTPHKGWWYWTIETSLHAPPTLAYPNDPLNVIVRPCCNATITAQQWNNSYAFVGYALDRNPASVNPNAAIGYGPGRSGPGQSGIASVALYLDALPGQSGSISLGNAVHGIPAVVNNPPPQPGPPGYRPFISTITQQCGKQYEFAGWLSAQRTRSWRRPVQLSE
jgi:hypothetical protein